MGVWGRDLGTLVPPPNSVGLHPKFDPQILARTQLFEWPRDTSANERFSNGGVQTECNNAGLFGQRRASGFGQGQDFTAVVQSLRQRQASVGIEAHRQEGNKG